MKLILWDKDIRIGLNNYRNNSICVGVVLVGVVEAVFVMVAGGWIKMMGLEG